MHFEGVNSASLPISISASDSLSISVSLIPTLLPSASLISITLSSLLSSPVWKSAASDLSTSLSVYITLATLSDSVHAASMLIYLFLLFDFYFVFYSTSI